MKKTFLIFVVLNVLILTGLAGQAKALILGINEIEIPNDGSWTTFPDGAIKFGDSFFIRGYIYPKGTLAEHCPGTLDCGVITGGAPLTGQPEFPEKQIGTYHVSGTLFADPFPGDLRAGEEVGLFQVIFQFEGGHTLIAKGIQRFGENESHPATLAVLGGTGAFAKARGELIEAMVTQNVSGAFTFSYDLSPVVHVKSEQGTGLIGGLLQRFRTR